MAVIEGVLGGRAIKLADGRLISKCSDKLLVQLLGRKGALLMWRGNLPDRIIVREVKDPIYCWDIEIDIAETKEVKTRIPVLAAGIVERLSFAVDKLSDITDVANEIGEIGEGDIIWSLQQIEKSLPLAK